MFGSSLYILSVYSPFPDRVGVPLHNIISPFLPVMDIFSVDFKFSHICFYTLTMSFLVVQPVFCLQLYTPYISPPPQSSSLFLITCPYHLSLPTIWMMSENNLYIVIYVVITVNYCKSLAVGLWMSQMAKAPRPSSIYF